MDVCLQDMAAMLVLHPEREHASAVNWSPLLRSNLFVAFKAKMATALNSKEDPTKASMQRVLPGAHDRLGGTDESMAGSAGKIEAMGRQMKTGFDDMQRTHQETLVHSSALLGASLVDVGAQLINAPAPDADAVAPILQDEPSDNVNLN